MASVLVRFAVLFVWTTFCLSAKWLHDRGRSAWDHLMILVPAGQIWHFIHCGCLAGDPGPNAYGPPPGNALGRVWKRRR